MDVKAVRVKSQWITMCSSLRIIIVATIDCNVFESSNNIVVFYFVFNQKHEQTSLHAKLQ